MEKVISKLLQEFEEGRVTRRQLIQSLTIASVGTAGLSTPALGADQKIIKALSFNHVSYQVADYKKTRDFYTGLFGMEVVRDDGMQCRMKFGDNILIARSRSPHPQVDHIAYTVANWEAEKPAIEAELKRRGLKVTAESDKSFHVSDPDGFNVQIGGKDQ